MKNLLNFLKSFFWLLFLIFTMCISSSANAQVYKCNINGKTIYSDAMCEYKAETLKINPNQNSISNDQPRKKPINNDNIDRESNNSKCDQLISELQNTGVKGTDSLAEAVIKRSKRREIKEEFNMICNSSRN